MIPTRTLVQLVTRRLQVKALMPYNHRTVIRRFSANSTGSRTSTLKLGLVGVVVGAAVGTAYSVINMSADKNDHILNNEVLPHIVEKRPDVKITKRVVNNKDTNDLDLILFQFQTCPFCCKVRSFLDFQGLSYSIVEVDAVLRQQLKWTNYQKVPLLLAKRKDGKYVQLTDSSTIISVLASYLLDTNQDIGEVAALYPSISFRDDNGVKKFDVLNKYFLMYQDNVPGGMVGQKVKDEQKWRAWVDNELVHLISPNVYRTRKEAFETFEWFSEAGGWDKYFPGWERNLMVHVGANAMWLISKRLKKKHNLTDNVRSFLYNALDKLTSELKIQNKPYLGGDQPNLADLSIYGVLCSMEGCSAFKECLENTEIGQWFYRVKDVVTRNRGRLIDDFHTNAERGILQSM